VEDLTTRRELAGWLRARGKERRETIWFRDAEVAEAVDAILFIGMAPHWYPPNYDCGACGYATCAEFFNATKTLRKDSAALEFTGPTCNLRDIDLGIAVGSAAKTAAMHSIDCRCQTRVAVAARKLGVITAEIAVALSLSVTHKAIGFDRRMPEVDFDALDLPATGTQPVAKDPIGHPGAARNRQQPRRPTPGRQRPPQPASSRLWGRARASTRPRQAGDLQRGTHRADLPDHRTVRLSLGSDASGHRSPRDTRKRLRPRSSELPLKRVSGRANGHQAEPPAPHFQRLEGACRRRGPAHP
jgi:uncharacterized ferredoxin-like protein